MNADHRPPRRAALMAAALAVAEVRRLVSPFGARRAAAAASALLGGLLGAAPGGARAQPRGAFDLVSAAEMQSELQAASAPGAEAASPTDAAPRTRSLAAAPRPGTPAIRVLAPSASTAAVATVTAPLRIELAFEPAEGRRIVPESFRILYGVLKLDLTERLRRHATISERGVLVEQALMPAGLHRLFMQVSDDRGLQGEHELRLRVGAPS